MITTRTILHVFKLKPLIPSFSPLLFLLFKLLFLNCNATTSIVHTMMTTTKPVMIVGIDDSEQSFFALEWTLDRFIIPSTPNPFNLIIVNSKPTPAASMGFHIPGN